MKLLSAAFVMFVLIAGIRASQLPDFIKVCSRNDPKINECIKNAVYNMRPYLKEGIKEFNVPAMEPLFIGDLNILEGGKTGINAKAKDLNIYGASNFEIKKLKSSNNGLRYDFELNLPHLQGEGSYYLNGQILTLPIRGNGPFTGNFTNFYAYVKVLLEKKNVNGEEYLAIKDLAVKIRTGKGSIQLQNLFNGDKTLGDVVNDTINQNFELFTNELIQPIERALERKFIDITRKMLENFTYEELFPV